jgi:hypothetical protein
LASAYNSDVAALSFEVRPEKVPVRVRVLATASTPTSANPDPDDAVGGTWLLGRSIAEKNIARANADSGQQKTCSHSLSYGLL